VFGNVGTIISFGIGAMDTELLETVFHPVFSRNDLLNLDKHSIYLKMAINGKVSQPFSARTLPPFHGVEFQGNRDKVIQVSRERYAELRNDVEDKIKRWMSSF
jgi:hypothetical protein